MKINFKTLLGETLWGSLGEPSQKSAFASSKNALIRELKAFVSEFKRAKFKNKRVKNFGLGITPPPPFFFSFSR